MGMHGERNMWLSCTVLLRMLNVMPLERQTRGRACKVNAHVVGLNATENQQDREDSGKESLREGRQRQGARTRNVNKRRTRLELDSSLVDRFEVRSLASS